MQRVAASVAAPEDQTRSGVGENRKRILPSKITKGIRVPAETLSKRCQRNLWCVLKKRWLRGPSPFHTVLS